MTAAPGQPTVSVTVTLDREVAGYVGAPEQLRVAVGGEGEVALDDVIASLEGAGSTAQTLRDRGRMIPCFAVQVNGTPVARLDARVRGGDVVRVSLRFMEGG